MGFFEQNHVSLFKKTLMSITICTFLRVDQAHKSEGKAGIYLRFSQDRKKKDISLKKYLFPRKSITNEAIEELSNEERLKLYNWDESKERLTKGEAHYEQINFFLTNERSRAVKIITRYQAQEEELTPELFVKEFKGKKGVNKNAFDYFQAELKSRKKDYSAETYRTYGSILTKLRDYKPGLYLKDINHKFLMDYKAYMLRSKEEGGKGNDEYTANNNLKVIKTFVNFARAKKDIPATMKPFAEIKIKKRKGRSRRHFLDQFELEANEELFENYVPLDKPIQDLSPEEWNEREEAKLLTPAQHNVMRYFLFSCYTGLRFQDVKDLDYTHIQKRLVRQGNSARFLEKYYIEIDMHKTGFPVMIPLLNKALALIDVNKKEGRVFKVISNQRTNEHLAKIMPLAGVSKKITFHCSRHTFATVGLVYGIPQVVIQEILGHQEAETTEIYTHMVDDFLFNQMDKLEERLNSRGTQNKTTSSLDKTLPNYLLERLAAMDTNKLEKLIALAELV
jgi:integrase